MVLNGNEGFVWDSHVWDLSENKGATQVICTQFLWDINIVWMCLLIYNERQAKDVLS